MIKLTEADIKKQIKDCLWAVGARPVSIGAGTLGENGISDLLVCHKGEFIAIEAKRPGWNPPGRQTKAYKHYYNQKQFLDSIIAAGGKGFFATSVEDVVKKLHLNVKLYPLTYKK